MANLPDVLIFKILDEQITSPIANIAVILRLFAHKKNDYFVGPKLTDSEGIIEFSKSECLNEIELSKKMFLMDYASSLGQCLPKVSIQIMSEEQIFKLISIRRKNRKFWSDFCDCSEEFLNKLSQVNNKLYQSSEIEFKEEELQDMQNVQIRKTLKG